MDTATESNETAQRRETVARIGRAAGPLPAKPAKVPTYLSVGVEPAMRSRSGCEPYREIIATELAKGCNGKIIYQDLVEHHGYEAAMTPSSVPFASCALQIPNRLSL